MESSPESPIPNPASHAVSVVAWDIPSAIVVGEKFRMKVGIKCANECDLANTEFGIFDERGMQVSAGTLPAERWPGTVLHVAEVELEAPATEALYTWSVKVRSTSLKANSEPEGEIVHAEESINFGVRVVGRPEFMPRCAVRGG